MAAHQVPETMMAAQVVEFNKPYKIDKIPTPKPNDLGPHDLLLKVAVGSYCHTDSMVQSGVFGTKLPCTGSHEGAGLVVANGSSPGKWQIGDRCMAGIQRDKCYDCPDCNGSENFMQYCPNTKGMCGVTTHGSFAEYLVVDGRECAKIPEEVPFEVAAPLACAGCTIYRGLLQTEAKKGDWIAIIGAGGGLGHLGIQMGKAMGFKIVGIDARDGALDLIKQYGADIVLDARAGNDKVVKQVAQQTGTEVRGKHSGVDASIVLSEHETATALSCAVTRMHGTVVQIAQPPEVTFPFQELVFRDIRIKGSLHSSRQEAQDMLDFVAKHDIQVKVNKFYGVEELPRLLDLVHSGKLQGKGVIVMDKGLVQ